MPNPTESMLEQRIRIRRFYQGSIDDLDRIILENPQASKSLTGFQSTLKEILKGDIETKLAVVSIDHLLRMLDMLVTTMVCALKTKTIKAKPQDPNDRRPLSEDPFISTVLNLDAFVARETGRLPRTDIVPAEKVRCEYGDHDADNVNMTWRNGDPITICQTCMIKLAAEIRADMRAAS